MRAQKRVGESGGYLGVILSRVSLFRQRREREMRERDIGAKSGEARGRREAETAGARTNGACTPN